MPGKLYDLLKFIALVLLPAAGALYVALGSIWGFPNIEQVVGTITAVDTFLGILLDRVSKIYHKNMPETKVMGDLVTSQYPDGSVAGLRIESALENPIFEVGTLAAYKVVRGPVVPEPDPSQE